MSIYVVIGITKDPTRVWPVTWSVEEADSIANAALCKQQAKAFVDELKPVWAAMEELGKTKPDEWSNAGYRSRVATQRRNKSFENQQLVYDTKRTRLEVTEHEINIKHRDAMLDALFPTGNEGWCPEVDYVVWTLYEDMRSDLKPSQLMLIRAKLHANEEEDSIYEDIE